MVQNKKNIIPVLLIVVFLLPTTIKLIDGFFHHHDHFICTAKNEKHFHKHHEKCPIPSFEFSLFSKEEPKQVKYKQPFGTEIANVYSYIYCSNRIDYSFLLRAPPQFTNITKTIKKWNSTYL